VARGKRLADRKSGGRALTEAWTKWTVAPSLSAGMRGVSGSLGPLDTWALRRRCPLGLKAEAEVQERAKRPRNKTCPAIVGFAREVIVGAYAASSGDTMPETLDLIRDGAPVPTDLLREMRAARVRFRKEMLS
jgi:hypothetical protein